MYTILWTTESFDGVKCSVRINKSRKHLLCKCKSLDNPSHSSLIRLYTLKRECSKNCYCLYRNDISVLLAHIILHILDKKIEQSLHAGVC